MNFDQYRILRQISKDRGVSFYESVSEEDNKTYLLRVFEESADSNQSVDDWYNLHGQYQERVTNFKHLPRVKEIQSVSTKQAYVVLHHEPGKILRERQGLNAEQMEQMVDAVMHLHAKGLVHGGFTPDRVWITDEGKVILYGALEWLGAKEKHPTQATDVAQLVNLFINFADLSAEQVLELKNTPLKSLEQIQQFLQQPVKAGLVEKSPPKRDDKPVRDGKSQRNDPVGKEQPFQNQRPVGNERPVQNQRPGNERPFQNQSPVGNERPVQNQRPVGNERPFQNQPPVGNERPVQNQRPGNERPFQNQPPFGNQRQFQNQPPFRQQNPNYNQQPFPNQRPNPKKSNLPVIIGVVAAVGIVLVGGIAYEVGKLSGAFQSVASSNHISSGPAGPSANDNSNSSSNQASGQPSNTDGSNNSSYNNGTSNSNNGTQSSDSGSTGFNGNGNSSSGSSNFNNNGSQSTNGNSSFSNNGTPSSDGSTNSNSNNTQSTFGSSSNSGNGAASPFNAAGPASEVPSLVMQYMSNAVQAVDQNNFSLVQPWLIPNSNLYKEEQSYISNISSQGITEEMLGNDVTSVTPSHTQSNTYDVVVNAQYRITHSDGTQATLDESDQFVVYDDGNQKGLSDISVLTTKTE